MPHIHGFNEQLRDTLRAMLRPVVRLAIGKVSFHGFVSVLEGLFYELAYETAATINPGRQVTDQAISNLTGMTPHRVALLRGAQSGEDSRTRPTRTARLPEASILELWWHDPTFSTSSGAPRALSVDGPSPSFADLVAAAVSKSASVDVHLNSLINTGAVEMVSDQVVCRSRFFTTLAGLDETALISVSHSYRNFSHAIEHNLERPKNSSGRPWPQRERWSRWVPESSYPRLSTLLLTRIDEFSESVEHALTTYESKPAQPAPADTHRTVGVGVYYWERGS